MPVSRSLESLNMLFYITKNFASVRDFPGFSECAQSNHTYLCKGKRGGRMVEGSRELRVIEKLDDSRLPPFKIEEGTMSPGKQADYRS